MTLDEELIRHQSVRCGTGRDNGARDDRRYACHTIRRAKDAEIARLKEKLRPFAGAVFNDNGDMTVTFSAVNAEHFIAAYFALKEQSHE